MQQRLRKMTRRLQGSAGGGGGGGGPAEGSGGGGGGGSRGRSGSIYDRPVPQPSVTTEARPPEFKILVVGSAEVNKDQFILQFVKNEVVRYQQLERSAMGIDFYANWKKRVDVDGKSYILDLHDCPSSVDSNSDSTGALIDELIRTADGFIFIYSINSRDSFQDALLSRGYAQRTRAEGTPLPMILVGKDASQTKPPPQANNSSAPSPTSPFSQPPRRVSVFVHPLLPQTFHPTAALPSPAREQRGRTVGPAPAVDLRQVDRDEGRRAALNFECPFREIPTFVPEESASCFLTLVKEIVRYKQLQQQAAEGGTKLNPSRATTQAAKEARKSKFRFTVMNMEDIKFEQVQNSTQQPRIIAASIMRVVERITYEKYPYPALTASFLLTYRSFITPSEFMELLFERYMIAPSPGMRPLDAQSFVATVQTPVRLRVFNVLRLWVLHHFYDFEEDTQLMATLQQFIDGPMKAHSPSCGEQLDNLIQRQLVKRSKQRELMFDVPPPKPILPKKRLTLGEFEFLDLHPLEVARQLTLIDHKYYKAITPNECLLWHKLRSSEEKKQTCPNVSEMINRFNRGSLFVRAEVVLLEKAKARASCISRWIQVAQACLSLNNFNGTMMIVSALEDTAIYRLKKSWKLVSKKAVQCYEDIKVVVEARGGYPNLRAALRNRTGPLIPYLGLFLSDLLVLDDTMPDYSDEHALLINIEKCERVAKVIHNLQAWQQSPYCLTSVPAIEAYLSEDVPYEEQELYRMSCKVEPTDSRPAPTAPSSPSSGSASAPSTLSRKTVVFQNETKAKTIAAVPQRTTVASNTIFASPSSTSTSTTSNTTTVSTSASSPAVPVRPHRPTPPMLSAPSRSTSTSTLEDLSKVRHSNWPSSNLSCSLGSLPPLPQLPRAKQTVTSSTPPPIPPSSSKPRSLSGANTANNSVHKQVPTSAPQSPVRLPAASPALTAQTRASPPVPSSPVLSSSPQTPPRSNRPTLSSSTGGLPLSPTLSSLPPVSSLPPLPPLPTESDVTSSVLPPLSSTDFSSHFSPTDKRRSGGNRVATLPARVNHEKPAPPSRAGKATFYSEQQLTAIATVPTTATTASAVQHPFRQSSSSEPNRARAEAISVGSNNDGQGGGGGGFLLNKARKPLAKNFDDIVGQVERLAANLRGEALSKAIQEWLERWDKSEAVVSQGGHSPFKRALLHSTALEAILKLLLTSEGLERKDATNEAAFQLLSRTLVGRQLFIKDVCTFVTRLTANSELSGILKVQEGEASAGLKEALVAVIAAFKLQPLDLELLEDLTESNQRATEIMLSLQEKEDMEGAHSLHINEEKIELSFRLVLTEESVTEIIRKLRSVDPAGTRQTITYHSQLFSQLEEAITLCRKEKSLRPETLELLKEFFTFFQARLRAQASEDEANLSDSLRSVAEDQLDSLDLHVQQLWDQMYLLHRRVMKLHHLTQSSPTTPSTESSQYQLQVEQANAENLQMTRKLLSRIDLIEGKLNSFVVYYEGLINGNLNLAGIGPHEAPSRRSSYAIQEALLASNTELGNSGQVIPRGGSRRQRSRQRTILEASPSVSETIRGVYANLLRLRNLQRTLEAKLSPQALVSSGKLMTTNNADEEEEDDTDFFDDINANTLPSSSPNNNNKNNSRSTFLDEGDDLADWLSSYDDSSPSSTHPSVTSREGCELLQSPKATKVGARSWRSSAPPSRHKARDSPSFVGKRRTFSPGAAQLPLDATSPSTADDTSTGTIT